MFFEENVNSQFLEINYRESGANLKAGQKILAENLHAKMYLWYKKSIPDKYRALCSTR